MIVPDGRTDLEKLKELLGNPEQTHLDLKASVDLSSPSDKLKFVKDAVAMASRPEGGYILVGVDDDGNPCAPIGTIEDRAQYDGSRVGALIRGYVEASVHAIVEIHELDSHEIVVIYVHNPDGLPIPFNKAGEHPNPNAGGKDVTVFRKGEIFVREGPENVPIRYAHWADLLASYADDIRAHANETALSMLREVLAGGSGQPGDTGGVPLLMDMDETTFTATAIRLLETGRDVRLRQFLRTVYPSSAGAVDLSAFSDVLDHWTIFCAQALNFDRADLVDDATDTLVEVYESLGVDDDANRRRLVVVERIYIVGSLAVRLKSWDALRSLVLRPVPGNSYEPDYVYSSWIRAAQVYASRAGLTDDRRGGNLLSAARELMVEHPAMRPDLPDGAIPQEVTHSDSALNSLCQFDFTYCLVVRILGTGRSTGYPSSAAFDEDRVTPITRLLVSDRSMRHRLLPDATDAEIGAAVEATYEVAIRESANTYGGRWSSMPASVDAFVANHRSA